MNIENGFKALLAVEGINYRGLCDKTGFKKSMISQLKSAESINTAHIEKIIKPFDNWTVERFFANCVDGE